MNLKNATSALNHLMEADVPTMLWGPPGVGKSDCVRAIAKPRSWKVIDFRASTRDPVALMGIPDIAGDTTKWKVPDEFPQEDRDGAAGILFLDEINAAAPSMQAACFGLVLDRKVGEYRLPPGWRIVAAGNRQSDRASAQRMPTALANRFAHIDIEPDLNSWLEWAVGENIPPLLMAFLRWRPALLHMMPEQDARSFPTPRSWAQVAKVADAPESLRLGLVTSLVGEGAASEFEGFVRIYRDLPSLDKILADPEGTEVPQSPASRYAIATALAAKVTHRTLGAAITYMRRVAKEFEILLVFDAVRRQPGLSDTQAFTDWSVANEDIVLG